jgi:hypothetical protein
MARIELPSGAASPTASSNARRREALTVLREAGAPLALADLAADIVAAERPGGAPDYDAIQQCRIMLYHVHVPRLVEAGAVEFDPARQVVAPAA